MTTLKVRFDGRVLIPETPLDLPQNQILEIHLEDAAPDANGKTQQDSARKSTLEALVEISRDFPDDPDTPTDLAAQHDHYLYGTPKRP